MTRHYKPITHRSIDQHHGVEREADDNLRFADIYQGEMDEIPEFFRQRRNYIDHLGDKHE